ncbi:MAG: hypothetical protein M1538_00925 [Candidatus Marsarchaeota archaeon]|nr:hypothetical protein [Candidatus Marsarchaeota archaeon]
MTNKHLIEQKGNKPNIKRYLLLIVFALFVNFLLIHSVAAVSSVSEISIQVFPPGSSTSTIIPGEEVTVVVPTITTQSHSFTFRPEYVFPPGQNPPQNDATLSAAPGAQCPFGYDSFAGFNMISLYNQLTPGLPTSGPIIIPCYIINGTNSAGNGDNIFSSLQQCNNGYNVGDGIILGDMSQPACFGSYSNGNGYYMEFTSRNFSATPPDYPYTIAVYSFSTGNLIGTAHIYVNVSAPRPYTDTSASNAYADVYTAVNGQSDVRLASVPIGFPFDFVYGGRFSVLNPSNSKYDSYSDGYTVSTLQQPLLTTWYSGVQFNYSYDSGDSCSGNDGADKISTPGDYFDYEDNGFLLDGPCYPGYNWYVGAPILPIGNENYVAAYFNTSPDQGAQGSSGTGDFAAAGVITMNGLINCTGVMLDGSQFISSIGINSVYCIYYNNGWSASSSYSNIFSALNGCYSEGDFSFGTASSPPGGEFLCANGIVEYDNSNSGNSGSSNHAFKIVRGGGGGSSSSSVNNYYPALSSACELNSSSPNINCFVSDYSGPSLTTSICGPGNEYCIAGGSLTLAPVTSAICSVYTIVNSILFILALTIMLIGGTLYAGAHVMPAQSRGIVQGYAMGMIIGGVVAVIIAMVAPWVLSIVTNVPISQITTVCT